MKLLYRNLALSVFILLWIVADQVTKLWALEAVRAQPVRSYWSDFFRFQYAENTGAFLSLGANLPDPWRVLIFNLMVGLIILGVIVVTYRKHHPLTLSIALSLIIAGGLGNLIDRIFRDGRVIDFMNMGIGGLRTGIFNVADIAITSGCIALFIAMFSQPSLQDAQQDHPNSRAGQADDRGRITARRLQIDDRFSETTLRDSPDKAAVAMSSARLHHARLALLEVLLERATSSKASGESANTLTGEGRGL